MRNLPGNHLRVLAHERKAANHGETEKHKTGYLKKQQVEDLGRGTDKSPGATK